ncbi:MAG TPA: histidine kinase [Bacteroidota bacterium]|nr:histidine kinase [Bacteroidota bacterium]
MSPLEMNLMWGIVIASLLLVILSVGLILTIYFSQRRVIGLQQRMLKTLEKSEKKYKDLFNHAIEGIYQSTPDGRYININPALAQIYGYSSPAEMLADIKNIGQQLYVDPKRREEFMHLLERDGEVHGFEYQAYRKDRSIIWISGNARVVRDESGTILYYEGTVEDITHRKMAEAELRKVPHLILEAQESERKRIARELHDSIGQLLSAAKMRIHTAAASLKMLRRDIPTNLDQAGNLLQRGIEEVRRISQNLRPSELDDLGLIAALNRVCDDFCERTRIQLNLSMPKSLRELPGEMNLALYRIIQEGLHNVEKHSEATRVDLSLSIGDSTLTVRLKDNGKGFDLPKIPEGKKQKTFGLIGMRERVALMGGSFDLFTKPQRGTEIRIRLPVPSLRERRAS